MSTTTINSGIIGSGITLPGDYTLSNTSSGTITNGAAAVLGVASALPDTVVNAGSIGGGTGAGITLLSGGMVTNTTLATISGAVGVGIAGGIGTVTNQGLITASGNGVRLDAGGGVTNLTGGAISSTGGDGVAMYAGGSVTNQTSASVVGQTFGVDISGGGGTVTNAGTISATDPGATARSVRFGVSVTNRLIVDPGAVFNGAIDGGNTIGNGFTSTLEMASGASAGAFAGIGSQYVGFGAITIDAGAQWTLSGVNTIAAGATLTNSGTLINTGSLNAVGLLLDNGSLTNSGTLRTTLVMTGGAGLTNNAGRTFYGAVYAAGGGADRTITNSGTITDSSGIAIVNFQSGGTVINALGATISGIRAIDINGAASIGNSGQIIAIGAPGTNGSAVILRSGGGTVTNAAGATINGQFYGVVIGGGVATVTNGGSIRSGAEVGVALNGGGAVTNMSGGTITAHYTGVNFHAFSGTFTNAGYVESDTGTGAGSDSGGAITNLSGGTIIGHGAGLVIAGAAGTISNAGSIAGGGGAIGVFLGVGGTITNESGGRISAYGAVQVSGGAATLINRGDIVASGPRAVVLAAGFANSVSVAPGGLFVGSVDGGNTIGAGVASTLELTSAATTGTLSGLGAQFFDFAKIDVDSGASWVLNGANTVGAGVTLTVNNASVSAAGTLVNDGTILLDPSTMTVGGLTGTGGVTIGAGSTLSVQGAVAAGETLSFASASGVLALATPGVVAGTIAAFVSGDTIELTGISNVISTDVVNGNTLQVSFSSGGPVDLALSGSFTGDFFHHALVGSDTVITEDNLPCYLSGTLILTDRGEIPVEALSPGERVVTLSGAARAIKWIGFGRTLVTPRNRCDVSPVVIRRGALATNVPHSDLWLTRKHAILVGEVLVPAELLVNGVSVQWGEEARVVEYYHIELETHDVVIANGAPAESFRDDGSRDLFQNSAQRPPRMAEAPCRPIVDQGPELRRAWCEVAARSGEPAEDWLTNDPGLHLLVDGRRVDPVHVAGEASRFRLERVRHEVFIVSRSCIPRAHGLGQDARRLGVGIIGLTLYYQGGRRILPLWADELAAGFHGLEGDIRWTKGAATLSASLFNTISGPVELEVRLGGTLRYPRELTAA